MPEKLFGVTPADKGNGHDAQGLKLVLHRYIIDAIEDSGRNMLEGARPVATLGAPGGRPKRGAGPAVVPISLARWAT